MRGMQIADEFAVYEGGKRYQSPMSGSWNITKMGQPDERVYCEIPEDVPLLQEMLNRGFKGRATHFARDESPVFLMPKSGGEIIYLGTVSKVKEDTGRKNIAAFYAGSEDNFAGEISDIVDDIATGWAEPVHETKKYDDDIVSRIQSCTTQRQIERLQECIIYESTFKTRQELGLSVDYFKNKPDFRYRRKKKTGTAGGWVSKKYVQEALGALKEYDVLKDVCRASKGRAKSAKEASRRWSDSVKSINGMRKISEKYFTEDAQDDFAEFTKIILERKALDLATYAKDDGIEHQSAVQAFAWLLKSNHPARLNKARDLADKYVTSAIHIVEKRIKDVVMRNSALYGSAYPSNRETIQLKLPDKLDFDRPVTDYSRTRNVDVKDLFREAGYKRVPGSDTRNIRIPGNTAKRYGNARPSASPESDTWRENDMLVSNGLTGNYDFVRAEDTDKLKPLRKSTLPPHPPVEQKRSSATPPPLPWEKGGSGNYDQQKPRLRKVSTLPPHPPIENIRELSGVYVVAEPDGPKRSSTPPPLGAAERAAAGLQPLENIRSKNAIPAPPEYIMNSGSPFERPTRELPVPPPELFERPTREVPAPPAELLMQMKEGTLGAKRDCIMPPPLPADAKRKRTSSVPPPIPISRDGVDRSKIESGINYFKAA